MDGGLWRIAAVGSPFVFLHYKISPETFSLFSRINTIFVIANRMQDSKQEVNTAKAVGMRKKLCL